MNVMRRVLKKRRIVQHRKERYQHAIQKVIDGEAEPEYATKRFRKLKEARGNGK